MESINSDEKFGNASLSASNPPMHTDPDHRHCAYYLYPSEDQELGHVIQCPHGQSARGAFYSEDYLNELRRTSHALINVLEGSNQIYTRTAISLVKRLKDLTK